MSEIVTCTGRRWKISDMETMDIVWKIKALQPQVLLYCYSVDFREQAALPSNVTETHGKAEETRKVRHKLSSPHCLLVYAFPIVFCHHNGKCLAVTCGESHLHALPCFPSVVGRGSVSRGTNTCPCQRWPITITSHATHG